MSSPILEARPLARKLALARSGLIKRSGTMAVSAAAPEALYALPMSGDLDERRRRALYRARHRGTKELDWLVGRFADAHVASMSAEELERFERFVALPDPVIEGLVFDCGESGPPSELISALRHFHGLAADTRPGNDDGA